MKVPAPLVGTSWQLVKIEYGDGATHKPNDKAKYTLTFLDGTRLAARIVGEDSGTLVNLHYDVPFKFTGKLDKVTINLK